MIVPILGCTLPTIGRIKTIMSNEKTIMGVNKIISLSDAVKEKSNQEASFSKDLYHWVMFIITLYSRVKAVSYTHLTLPTNREV